MKIKASVFSRLVCALLSLSLGLADLHNLAMAANGDPNFSAISARTSLDQNNSEIDQTQTLQSLSVYSQKEIQDSEAEFLSHNIVRIWNSFIKSKNSNNQITYGDYTVRLNQGSNSSLYLEIENNRTHQKFYNFMGENSLKDSFDANDKTFEVLIDPNTFAGIDSEDFQSLNKLAEQDISSSDYEKWDEGAFIIQSEVKYLYELVLSQLNEARERYKDLSTTEFIDKVVETKSLSRHYELGQTEVNAVDGKLIIRIVHKKSELSFIISEQGSINYKSEHFAQYIARQHMASGSSRTDGQIGRDVVLIEVENFNSDISREMLNPAKQTPLNRLTKYSKEWWREYWLAIKKAPDIHAVTFGLLVSSNLQFILALASGHLLASIGLPVQNITTIAIASAVWGGLIGVFISTYKNWESLGTMKSRARKNLTQSLLFRGILSVVIGGNMLHALNPFSSSGFVNDLRIYYSSKVNNISKPHYYNIGKLREDLGISRSKIKTKLFNKFEIVWSRSNFENQVIYLGNFLFSILERINFGQTPENPIGISVFIAQIPFVHKFYIWYADYLYKKDPVKFAEAKFRRDKAQTAFDQFVRFYAKDKEVPTLLRKKYFSFNLVDRIAAHNELSRRYPDRFGKERDAVTEIEARRERQSLMTDILSYKQVSLASIPELIADKANILQEREKALEYLRSKYPALYPTPIIPESHYQIPAKKAPAFTCEGLF